MELSGASEPYAGHGVGVLDVLAFCCELAVFGLLAVSGWHLADSTGADGTGLRLALAVLLPMVAMVAWGLLLAPRSARRLAQPLRLGAALAVFAATAAVAGAAGLGPVAQVVPIAAALVFGADLVAGRRAGRHA